MPAACRDGGATGSGAERDFRFARVVQPIGAETVLTAPLGVSIGEIAEVLFKVGPDHRHAGQLLEFHFVNAKGQWEYVPPKLWLRIKPKRNDVLRCYARMQGGRGGQTLALIATIAIAVIAPAIGAAIFGAGTLGAAIATVGIQLGSAYLIGRLTQQRARGNVAGLVEAEAAQGYRDVTSDGNVLAREGFLPSVYGKVRTMPADVMQPREYLSNGILSIERLLAFDGPTRITETRIDGTAVADISAIEVETTDGRDGSAAQTLVTKYAAAIPRGDQLSNFSANGTALEDQDTPANSEPRWVYFSTPNPDGLDEISLRLVLQSFLQATTATTPIRVPVRIRFRPKGGAWHYLPEIHLTGKDARTLAKEIRFRWDGDFGAYEPSQAIGYEFWQQVPASTNTRSSGLTGVQWQADSHFVAGSGLQDCANILGQQHGIRVTLNEATFPKAEYEWSVIRGGAIDQTALDGNYKISGAVPCLFEGVGSGTWLINQDQANYAAQISLVSASAIVEGNPVAMTGIAQLALRSVGQSLRAVDCLAEGYVDDYNDGYQVIEFDLRSLTFGGSDWTTGGTVTRFRIDLVGGVSGGSFLIDFIEILDGQLNAGYREEFDTIGAWSSTAANISVSDGKLLWEPTGVDPTLTSPVLALDGSTYYRLRIGVKKAVAGTGWEGSFFFSNGGHGSSGSYKAILTEPDWSSLQWDYLTASRNPASILRGKMAEYLNKGGVSLSLIDNASMLAFRTACENNGWKADGIAAGEPIAELFDNVSKGGFGQVFAARDRLGVYYLKDTSAVTPKIVLSPRNSANLSVAWEEPELPLGLRAKFVDEADGYRENEIFVGSPVPTNLNTWMPADFPSIKTETQVRALAEYAMLTAYWQTIRFHIGTFIEGLALWPGDIVAVSHDLLDDTLLSARVTAVTDARHFTIDQEIPAVYAEEQVDISDEPVDDDILAAGEFSEITVITPNGAEKFEIIEVDGRDITITGPLSSTDIVGAPCVIGSQQTPARRMIVLNAEPGEEFSTTLTLTDEAQQIWAYLSQKYGWS